MQQLDSGWRTARRRLPVSEGSPPMSSAASRPALLVVHTGETSHAIEPGRGVVTIGREPQAGLQIDDPQISQQYLRAEPTDEKWRIVDTSPSGMFVDGQRKTSVTI